ncbi:hypothetical protein [Acinetobacter sp.]|uniref:hypothetical protein n=1 Tax=Acinetobacter sp. TaxID=472 RepID=UPI00388E3280
MKLSEIKLFEEPIETRAAEELWQENGSEAAEYITTTVYFVRPISDKKGMYEVLYDEQGKRKTYGTMNKEDLDASFALMRPNQQPDAEGFLTYRSGDVYEAFKYGGDPVKVTLGASKDDESPGGLTVKLSKGDFILRQDNGDEFTYTVEKANYFSNQYTRKT